MSQWVAEITNNPDKDYELYVELLEDNEYRARIEMSDSDHLVLKIYNTEHNFSLSVDWLSQVIAMAKKEIQHALHRE